MVTGAGAGAVKVSNVKGITGSVGTFSVSRIEEQTREDVARKNPGLEKWFSGSAGSGAFGSGIWSSHTRLTGTSQPQEEGRCRHLCKGHLQFQSWDWDPRGGEGMKSCSFLFLQQK